MKKSESEKPPVIKSEQLSNETEQAVSRRKVIISAVAGGAVVGVAGKVNPGQWTKPVVDGVLIPAHGSTTGAGSDPGGGTTTPDPSDPGGGTTTPDPCPEPFTCGGGVAEFPLTLIRKESGAQVSGGGISTYQGRGRILNTTATVCPPVAGVSVSLNSSIVNSVNVAGSNIYVSSVGGGTPQLTNASGVATFTEVNFTFNVPSASSSGSVGVELVFTAGSDECTLPFGPFTEMQP